MAGQPHTGPGDDHQYLLWLLSDSNLPTGGFIASSGLESYCVHGFLHQRAAGATTWGGQGQEPQVSGNAVSADRLAKATVDFVATSLGSYASSAVPYLLEAHRAASEFLDGNIEQATKTASANSPTKEAAHSSDLRTCLDALSILDDAYNSFTLNHVLRRASKAQGMALLTLYSKSFAEAPLSNREYVEDSNASQHKRQSRASTLIDGFKKAVRAAASRSSAPHAHLPVCWGAFAACIGIDANDALSLHLFLQARAILHSSIRLNTLGPYLAHGLLLYDVRKVVNDIMTERDWHRVSHTGLLNARPRPSAEIAVGPKPRAGVAASPAKSSSISGTFERDWDWDDRGAWADEEAAYGNPDVSAMPGSRAPVNTWPLGEIVQARHDVLHSRLFNS